MPALRNPFIDGMNVVILHNNFDATKAFRKDFTHAGDDIVFRQDFRGASHPRLRHR